MASGWITLILQTNGNATAVAGSAKLATRHGLIHLFRFWPGEDRRADILSGTCGCAWMARGGILAVHLGQTADPLEAHFGGPRCMGTRRPRRSPFITSDHGGLKSNKKEDKMKILTNLPFHLYPSNQ